jgi:hypothetical protein
MQFWPQWSSRCRYAGSLARSRPAQRARPQAARLAPPAQSWPRPTASLPEWIGGGRNWDYRFTWLRDASWTLGALIRLGLDDEAHAFFWWLMHATRLTRPRLQILYRIDGSNRAKELEVPELLGYRGSAPVRIGNGAVDQVQLDVYGAVFEAIWLYAEHVGHIDGETGREVAKIADYVSEHWRDRDSGIWEVRSETAHFTQSKALCWVALERASALAERGLISEPSALARRGRPDSSVRRGRMLERREAQLHPRARPAGDRREPADARDPLVRLPRQRAAAGHGRRDPAGAAGGTVRLRYRGEDGVQETKARSSPARSGSSTPWPGRESSTRRRR